MDATLVYQRYMTTFWWRAPLHTFISNQKAKGDACGLTSDTDDRASSLHQYAIPLRCCIYVHMNRLNLDSINMNT